MSRFRSLFYVQYHCRGHAPRARLGNDRIQTDKIGLKKERGVKYNHRTDHPALANPSPSHILVVLSILSASVHVLV
jgi:hypothetical protein